MTTTTDSAATGCGGRQRSRPRGSGSIAAQIKEQRRGYAHAVLRALARAYQGRAAAAVLHLEILPVPSPTYPR